MIHRRQHHSGGQIVHVDAMLGELERETAGKISEASFR